MLPPLPGSPDDCKRTLDASPFSSSRSNRARQVVRPTAVSSVLVAATLLAGVLLVYARGLPGWYTRSSAQMYLANNSRAWNSVFSMLGPYSPWISRSSNISNTLPPGCEVSQVTILQRHGARFPTDGANDLIQDALLKLANVNASALPPSSPFKFITDFTFTDFEPGSLTDFGRKEAFDAGRVFAKRYQKLAKKMPYWVRASDQQRVVQSARFFMHGFQGGAFALGNVSSLPEVDMLVSEAEGFDNPLSISTCLADNILIPHPGEIAEKDWRDTYGPAIADRVNEQLPGAELTPANILSLMSLCGFASLRYLEFAKSPWCDAFSMDEWKLNDYYYDVSKYYANSYGSPFGQIKGASYVNELVARLTDSTEVVQAGATNLSAVSPPGGERIFVDFSHDNDMVAILSAMEMMKDSHPLPTRPHPVPPLHTFHVSSMVPFSGRFVFERISCPSGRGQKEEKTFVRTLINDAVIENGHPDGLVPLDAFLASVSFAQSGGDWARCLADTSS